MSNTNPTKVIVPCRLSYAHLWEPDSINGSEPKYSVSCIIDKENTEIIAKIKKAIEVAKEEGKGKWGGKIPANLKTPYPPPSAAPCLPCPQGIPQRHSSIGKTACWN